MELIKEREVAVQDRAIPKIIFQIIKMWISKYSIAV